MVIITDEIFFVCNFIGIYRQNIQNKKKELSSPKNTSNYRRLMNNTRLISPRNTSNSRRIIDSFTKWSWTWHHIVVIYVRLLFGRITTSLFFLLLQLHHYVNLIFFLKHIQFVMNILINFVFLFLMFNKILFA
jgi:hypothetical protein